MNKSEIRPAPARSVTEPRRLRWLCCGTAMVSVMAASAAQPPNARRPPRPVSASSEASTRPLPISSVGSSVQSLVGVLTTQNTASLTQTSGFIGAPANPAENLNGGGVWVRGLGGAFRHAHPRSLFGQSPACSARPPPARATCAPSRTSRAFGRGTTWRASTSTASTSTAVSRRATPSPTVRSSASGRLPAFVGLYERGCRRGQSFFAGRTGPLGLLPGPAQRSEQHPAPISAWTRGASSLTGNIGYQVPLSDGWFVEPSAGAVYSEVKVDALQTGGTLFIARNPGLSFPTSVCIQDFDSILARGSLRFGKNIVMDGVVLQPFVTASVINEFGAPVRADRHRDRPRRRRERHRPARPRRPGLVRTAEDRPHRHVRPVTGGHRRPDPQHGLASATSAAITAPAVRVDGWGVSGGLRYRFARRRPPRAR